MKRMTPQCLDVLRGPAQWLRCLRACLFVAALSLTCSVLPLAGTTANDDLAAPEPAGNDVPSRQKQEIEEQLRAAREQLSAIEQKLKTAGSPPLTAQERSRLEAEAAKLGRQIASLEQQLKVLGERGAAPTAESRPAPATAVTSQRDQIRIAASTPAAPTPPKGSVVTTASKPDESRIKVFTLRNMHPRDAERIVKQLFPREIKLAADERTNSLIASGPEEELNIVLLILTRLDEPQQTPVPARANAPDPNAVQPPPTWQPKRGLSPVELDKKSRDELQTLFDSKEQQAARLAKEIQQLQAASPVDKPRLNKLTADLRNVVEESFAASQYLRHKENAEIQQRAFRIWQTLENRFKIADQIIDRRVKDLLNPELQWGPVASGGQVRASNALPGATLLGQATNLTSARAYRDKLLEQWEPLEALFRGGRVPLDRVLSVANDLGPAESAAAATVAERRAALQEHVERVKRIKTLVADKHNADVEPVQNLRAAEAALIRAEAQLADADQNSGSSLSPGAIPPAPRPQVSYGALFDESHEPIWAALGLKVTLLTREEAPEPKYAGCLKITDISFGSPVNELKVGDIIIGLQSQGRSPKGQQVQLIILRGKEILPTVTVEFPQPQPPSRGRQDQPTSSEASRAASDLIRLRGADEYRRQLDSLELSVARLKAKDVTHFAGNNEEDKAKSRQEVLDRTERELAFLREEYAAQLRLLHLELKDSAAAAAAAASQWNQALARFQAKAISKTEVNAAERAMQSANLRHERARTLLELYQKADPQSATTPVPPGGGEGNK